MLVTGLASYVHYGAHEDGYRLTYFSAPLSPRWELVRTYNVLTYLPRPEPARLWRLRGAPTVAADGPLPREDVSSLADVNDFVALTRDGMARYQKEDYAGARVYFRKIIDDFPDRAEDAVFFYAASFFRQSDWPRARKAGDQVSRQPLDTRRVLAHRHLRPQPRRFPARPGAARVPRRAPRGRSALGVTRQRRLEDAPHAPRGVARAPLAGVGRAGPAPRRLSYGRGPAMRRRHLRACAGIFRRGGRRWSSAPAARHVDPSLPAR